MKYFHYKLSGVEYIEPERIGSMMYAKVHKQWYQFGLLVHPSFPFSEFEIQPTDLKELTEEQVCEILLLEGL